MKKKAIVVGAGIVGLSVARALADKGYNVTVVDKSARAIGASVRNFGMVWPIGQPSGELYQLARKSAEIWKLVCDGTGMWYNQSGSLHVANNDIEWTVLNELYDIFNKEGRPVQLFSKDKIAKHYPYVKQHSLLGGLYSSDELIVDPRIAVAHVSNYLCELMSVQFLWDFPVTEIGEGYIKNSEKVLYADFVFVCSGHEMETLFPAVFNETPITKCKLQMMRFQMPAHDTIGTSVCGGLSLLHYGSFKQSSSLPLLKKFAEENYPLHLQHGIHVMVSQHEKGELTVGDSHEYGNIFDPFDRSDINDLIIQYLNQFMYASDWKISESWHGIYPKMTDGSSWFFHSPMPSVYILNGLGGAGMTLSFGLAKKLIDAIE